jgi:hypothetical protein
MAGISSPGNGVSFVPGTIVPSNGAVVINAGNVVLAKSDDTGNLATVRAKVSGGSLQDVALPAANAVVANGGSVTVQNATGTTSVNAAATVTSNVLNFANFTGSATVVADAQSSSVTNNAGANSKNAAVSVTGGLLVGMKLANTTDALVSDGFTVTASGTGTTATIHVSGGNVTSVTLA